MSKVWDFYKMGTDMSEELDTIKRSKILDLLHQAGCSEDELCLVRILLARTKRKVHVKSTFLAEFETIIGSPEAFSVPFTCYLAAAKSSVWRCSTRPNPLISPPGIKHLGNCTKVQEIPFICSVSLTKCKFEYLFRSMALNTFNRHIRDMGFL
jgi:hypothetical protein